MADEADTPHVEAPRRAPPVVVPRWVQLVMLPLGVLALYALAQAAGVVLLLFIVAAVVALILNPLVQLLQRARLPRTLAVIAVYVAFFTALPVTGFLLSGPVSEQATSFANDVPGLVDGASQSLDDLQRFLHHKGIHVQIKGQSESALASLQKQIVAGSGRIVAVTGELLRTLVELSFYVILVIVLSIYMLIYAPEIGRLVRKVMPPGDGTPEDDFPTRVQHAVFGYVRGQLLFSLTMGASAGVALWIFGLLQIFPDGRTYAFAFGLFFGLMELVPYLGPLLGALPPIIVALAQDPLMAVWVALLFLALQQLEGHVVAPNIFARSLRLNPLLVIFALLLGGESAGVVGALIALPIASILRETVVYLREHLVFEPWGSGPPILIARPVGAADPAAPARDRTHLLEPNPVPDLEAEPEPNPEPDLAAEPEHELKSAPDLEPEHELKSTPDLAAEPEPNPEPDLAAEPEHELKSEPESETQPEPAARQEPEHTARSLPGGRG